MLGTHLLFPKWMVTEEKAHEITVHVFRTHYLVLKITLILLIFFWSYY